MKVVHVLKRIELIDEDIRELRKLEKTIDKDKSFSTPIYLSIEKQINLLLGERIKLIELPILNPPENYILEIEGPSEERKVEPARKAAKKKAAHSRTKNSAAKAAKAAEPVSAPSVPANPVDELRRHKPVPAVERSFDDLDLDSIPVDAQTMIDIKMKEFSEKPESVSEPENEKKQDDLSRKLLDEFLGKTSSSEKASEKRPEERGKSIKFLRDNFPSD